MTENPPTDKMLGKKQKTQKTFCMVAIASVVDGLISAMVELYTFVERATERSSRWSCSEPMKIAFVNASLNAFCSSCV